MHFVKLYKGRALPKQALPAAQEAKVGAGEQIIARRRSRRLVPEGTPLNARLGGAPSGNLGAVGEADEPAAGGNPMARRADVYRGQPRPSRARAAGGGPSPASSPELGGPGTPYLTPRTVSQDSDVFYPARSTASELPASGSPERGNGQLEGRNRGDVEAPGMPRSAFAQQSGSALPPGVAARLNTYYKD